jgi:FtsP/CotA-like multicopper oxidase with cupredoxin domain
MSTNPSRRRFLLGGTLATAGLLAGKNEPVQADEKHTEHDQDGHANTLGGPQDRGKLVVGRRKPGDPPVPIQTPDLPKLEPTTKDGVKEFQLICQHTKREFLPGQIYDVWGYNDSMPGPTIEVVEGDKVRILVHNMLPEATTLHLHGLELPIAMDGVPGLTQDPIPPHGNFVYEFQVHQNGTFFYHSHGAMQEGMGMVGLFIIHPKTAWTPPVDRDFGLIIQEWAILPGATVPNTMSMEFNYFTINGRSAPYITPLVVRQGDRVRIRLVNFSSIDHHPIHMHGMTFWVTGTEGGRIPESAWVPGNNILLGVAQARDIEFVASYPGDWMMHCHMFHHMMNHMTSMVGMMGSHPRNGPRAGGDMATGLGMLTRGHALSDENGAQLGRGTGEQTGDDRAVGNGPRRMAAPGDEKNKHAGHGVHDHGDGMNTPGYPQDMMDMDMYAEEEIKRFTKPETRGMRKDWYMGVEGLTTVIRVLPPELYEKVVSGKGEVSPGASVPGATSGTKHEHKH